jgi:transcriptional regulator with XRE-family HTH domain
VSDDLAFAIARGIRAERGRAGLSQQALATRLGWSRATVGAVETMERGVYAHELSQICKALGVTLDQLLARAPEEDRRNLGFV